MVGLVPTIHVFRRWRYAQDVDARDKPEHDGLAGPRMTLFLTS